MDSQIKNPDSFVAKESICNNTVPPCGEMDIKQTTLKRRFVHALLFEHLPNKIEVNQMYVWRYIYL